MEIHYSLFPFPSNKILDIDVKDPEWNYFTVYYSCIHYIKLK